MRSNAAGPRLVATAAASWPLHLVATSRRIEQAALAGQPPHALMERAGAATARLALALAPHARRVQVWAGPGNNGGDGLVAARWLVAHGRRVQVTLVADAVKLPADAAWALRLAREAGVVIGGLAPDDDADLTIDALLGLGTSRAAEGALAAAIDSANRARAPVLAVDLPSGLDADRGRILGSTAVRARWTISLLSLKPGLFTADGRDHAGEVWYDGLGVDGGATPPDAVLCCADPSPPPARRHAQHKGSFGDVVVVGGAAGMTGAAQLAARAALRAGAGRVYVATLGAAPPAAWPELMCRPQAWLMPPAELARCTVVCGCGGGADVAVTLPPLIAHAGRLVLDADALNMLAADSALATLLESRGRRGAPTVLTPHPLEAARLLACDAAQVQHDRLAAAGTLAERFGAVVVLKGSGSIVAAAGMTPSVNTSGNALLATPGSGDVLAGWIGGDWSARPGPGAAWPAALHATWLHGHAADRAATRQRLPLPAAALVDEMAADG